MLHIERRLHERVDEIQSIGSLVRAQVSLQRELRWLTRTLRRQCHVQRAAEFDVRFRRAQPHIGTNVDRHILQPEIARHRLGRARQHLAVLRQQRVDGVLELRIVEIDDFFLHHLRDVDGPALDTHRPAHHRILGRADERDRGTRRDVERGESALVDGVKIRSVGRQRERRIVIMLEAHRPGHVGRAAAVLVRLRR